MLNHHTLSCCAVLCFVSQMLCEGDEVTLLAWGNAIIQSVTRDTPEQQQQQCQQQAAPADAAVQAAADQGSLQQQQGGEVDSSAVLLGKSSTARQPSPHNGDVSPAADVCQSEAAAAAAVAFGGFRDVMALRDELQRAQKVPWGSSSCASTAGSTSVAALGSLLYDVEEAPEEALQSLHNVTTQQLIQKQQQMPAATKSPGCVSGVGQEVPGSNPRVVSMTARLNPTGSPKASKLKLHWLPNLPDQLLPLRLVRFGHPVLEEKVTEDVDVVAAFNHNSRWVIDSLVVSYIHRRLFNSPVSMCYVLPDNDSYHIHRTAFEQCCFQTSLLFRVDNRAMCVWCVRQSDGCTCSYSLVVQG